MDDDDDAGLLDFIGDAQALNYYLHGSGDQSVDDELTDFSASNSNSIFANASLVDAKSLHSPEEEESKDGMELSTNMQYYEDELEPSPMQDLTEDILQKSLQEANITEQILAEEAYLDASIESGQQFSNVSFHPHSSASFSQANTDPSYSGQTLHPIGVTHVPIVPQQLGGSFAGNTVGVQHGFMQHVGIIPGQQMPNSGHSSSGQIHVIGSINSQSPVMTINNIDGSQIILKSGQQVPPNASGGLVIQRQTPNGNAVFGSPNTSPAGQPVPFSSSNFQGSLPVHNIIIHRGPAPNSNKAPINIQPKPMQVGQQAHYNVSHAGVQHHHGHQGIPFVTAAQSSQMSQQMPVNQQRSRKPSSQQSGGGNIVMHSPVGQQHCHPNQFIIPAGLSLNNNSMQQIQAINSQLVQAQSSHLGPQQVPAEHMLMSRNSSGMVRSSQQYPGQMLHSPGTAVQIVPGQSFTSSGGQVILNHGPSQSVGGQMAQLSPTLLHLSPGQSTTVLGRSGISTAPSGCPNMSSANRFTIVSSGAGLQRTGFPRGAESYITEQEHSRAQIAMNETHHQSSSAKTSSSLNPETASQQAFSLNQTHKKLANPLSPVSSLKNQERQSHAHISSLTEPKHIQHNLSQLHNVKVEGHHRGLKRMTTKQLTKETLILQQVHRDQEHALDPNKSPFQSLGDAVQRLLPYHVFQGSMPANDELQKVDNEFEAMATHFLKKTQAMLNKYRLLLMEDAKRITPSAEMVMLDRIFNQEERATLTRDKRTALVDPDGYLTEFCCSSKFHEDPSEEEQLSNHGLEAESTSGDSSPTDSNKDDQTGSSSPKIPDPPCLVPTDSLTEPKCKDSPEDLKKDANFSPTKQLIVNLCKLKGKYTSCPSDTYPSCKASKERVPAYSAPNPIPVSGSKTDPDDAESPQCKTAGHSLETTGKQTNIVVNSKSIMSSKTVKETVRNVLELKLSAKHLKSEVSGSSSTETELIKCSEDHALEKPVSHTRDGAAETDSVLEAAVNSILDC